MSANSPQTQQRSPWFFIPTLYFMQGMPYMVVTAFSALMYRKLGVSVEQIATWTSLVTWPWVLKMFWGPVVDSISTKRKWVITTQGLIVFGFALVAFGIRLPFFFTFTLAVFFGIAFLSATHDIACDGFYLLAQKKDQQAFFVGIRSAAFRGAMLFTTSVMVVVAGKLEAHTPRGTNWSIALIVGTAAYGLCYLYGMWALPKPSEDTPGGVRTHGESIPFVHVMATYFKQPGIVPIAAFIVLYRWGEAMVMKIAPLFLIDPAAQGGLGLTTTQVGVINGAVGIAALTVGGLLGGILIARRGFRRCLWPMVICMHAPIVLYIWAAFTHPHVIGIYAVVAMDNFGYGFGLAAYLVYLMLISQTTIYKTSHYALSTGIMALGAMGAGIASGFIQQAVGYAWFFVACGLLTIPGTITLFFIPMDPGGTAVPEAPAREQLVELPLSEV